MSALLAREVGNLPIELSDPRLVTVRARHTPPVLETRKLIGRSCGSIAKTFDNSGVDGEVFVLSHDRSIAVLA